ncbi:MULTISPECIES: bacteriocin immunity protein [unclassified Pantoea]|uniref:bacteriocin immunity protein n=1 Tax=Pantoea TaxID=53335 RepID=UPI0021186FED|nr:MULTISPECIES: bacteriocin immunity protein [unclassified Pantoea]
MKFKARFEDYTEAEFIALVAEIFSAQGGEKYQDELLEIFIAACEHPEGSDLIFYNFDDDLTPEKVIATVREWRKGQGLADFTA